MLRLLVIALLIAAAANAQPLEGPFMIAELDSNDWIGNFRVLPSSSDTIGVIYSARTVSVSIRIYYAAFSFDTHALIGEPELLTSGPDGSLSLEGAASLPDGHWVCAIVQDLDLKVFQGHAAAVESHLTIAEGQMQGAQCWFTCWSYSNCHLAPRVGGGFVMAASEDWFFDMGGGVREVDGSPLLFVFDPGPLSMPVLGPVSAGTTFNSADAHPVSLDTDTTLVAVSYAGVTGSYCYTVSPGTPPAINDSICDFSLLQLLRTPGQRLLGAVRSYSYSEYPESGVIELADHGDCPFLGGFGLGDGWAVSAASSPDYGFAAVTSNQNFISLARLDTNGIMVHPVGTIFRQDTSDAIQSVDVGLASNGLIALAWSESDPAAHRDRIQIARLGWNTPLGTVNPHSIPRPSSLSLSAAPNPFNSTLEIRYNLPRAESIKLSVYNLLGQKVATLFDGMKAAGAHQEIWSPVAAGGVYFVSLRSTEATRTTKVLYLR